MIAMAARASFRIFSRFEELHRAFELQLGRDGPPGEVVHDARLRRVHAHGSSTTRTRGAPGSSMTL